MGARRYNELKLFVLAYLARHDWLTPGEVALATEFVPASAMWTYLLRLHNMGLLERRDVPRVEYRLSEKGWALLAWLERA